MHVCGDSNLVEEAIARCTRRWAFVRTFERDETFDAARTHGAREIDGAHAAAPELEQDLIRANAL
jgi:hypothetical protein